MYSYIHTSRAQQQIRPLMSQMTHEAAANFCQGSTSY